MGNLRPKGISKALGPAEFDLASVSKPVIFVVRWYT